MLSVQALLMSTSEVIYRKEQTNFSSIDKVFPQLSVAHVVVDLLPLSKMQLVLQTLQLKLVLDL